jgi:hypothetical protein
VLNSKKMADGDEWDMAVVATPDDIFVARLAEQAMRTNALYEVYVPGSRYASTCVDILLDNIKFLYGTEVSAQVRFCLQGVLNDESVLRNIGACWRIHSDANFLEHSRFDFLSAVNIDLRDVLEFIPIDCENMVSIWDLHADDADNLEIVAFHIEAVHGITCWYDFLALIRVIRPRHVSLLDVVVFVLKQQYGDFGHWRHKVRRRAAELEAMQPAVDWGVLLAP